jgi:copper chaperone
VKTILRSTELSCPSCVAKIEKGLKVRPGVDDARVFFNTGRIEVEHDPEVVSPDELAQAVTALGYQAAVAAY